MTIRSWFQILYRKIKNNTAAFMMTGAAMLLLSAGCTVKAAVPDLTDGDYLVEVRLEGGSGKTNVDSPAYMTVDDGAVTVWVRFSSPYYDYMILDGEKYEPVNTEGNSVFEIPVNDFDAQIPVTADTTAMSVPHEIEYTLYFDSATIADASNIAEITETATSETPEQGFSEVADNKSGEDAGEKDGEESLVQEPEHTALSGEDWCGLTWENSMDIIYATQFTVDYYEGGYARIVIAGSDVFLVVPEGQTVPEDLDDGVTILQQPITDIYLVATSAMDLFVSLDALDSIRLSGTDADGWYIQEAKDALEDGSILYAGKYNAPDYEIILSENCSLAIESTMIYHNPEVKENLENYGIPVLVERSSYESHPLGRTEWIKLYAVLLGREDEAEEFFDLQTELVREIESEESSGKTVAFFYITSSGTANVRRSDDYIAKMIELAGGTYIFADLCAGDNSLSTINMTMEEFYAQAKDADCIIYNSTIDGEIYTISQLLGKSSLLEDFKAVQEQNVWCTGKNLFQETSSLSDVIADMHVIFSEESPDEGSLNYLHRVADD